MVYHWDDKEAECYRLYVEEKRSLDEVISHFAAQNFAPSKRAFQTQFKRWGFPCKQSPAYKNPALVARVQQLWELNYSQIDMVDKLQAEGFSINDRELIRLRLRLKLLLRDSASRLKKRQTTSTEGVTPKPKENAKKKPQKKRAKIVSGSGLASQLTNVILVDESSGEEESEEESIEELELNVGQTEEAASTTSLQPVPTALSAEELLRQQLRQQQRQQESDEKWRTRKRRRRTRGWAGLPPDPPGEPPRFPSETTIDEAKSYLGLDNDMYREVRERFLDMCRENGVIKKTAAGPEKWALLVQQLIRNNTPLATAFEQEPDVFQSSEALFRPRGQRALSLDVICMDVTKRLRVMEKSMSLAEAKNLLCLNPERSRQVRAAFDAKLIANNLTNKLEASDELWTELKQAWVDESEYLTRALAQGEADPGYRRKLKAVDVLARDVMKRQQQVRTAKDPAKKKQTHRGPGPGPAAPVLSTPSPHCLAYKGSRTEDQHATTDTPPMTYAANNSVPSPPSDLQIDPSLLLAASDAAFLPTSDHQSTPYQYQDTQAPSHRIPTRPNGTSLPHYQHYYPAATSSSSASHQPSTDQMPLPVYFRLHPQSHTPLSTKCVWLSILHTPSVGELSTLAMREHHGTTVLRLEGVIAYRGSASLADNREVLVEIGNDDELGAYLAHVRGSGGPDQGVVQTKATFLVLLGSASSGRSLGFD